jgi:hypothetical protein
MLTSVIAYIRRQCVNSVVALLSSLKGKQERSSLASEPKRQVLADPLVQTIVNLVFCRRSLRHLQIHECSNSSWQAVSNSSALSDCRTAQHT